MFLEMMPLPCREEAFQVDWGIDGSRRQAPVGHAPELLDTHLLAQLWVGHDDQWLPSHVKPTGRRSNQNFFFDKLLLALIIVVC
jgi:hypothetical protein